MARFNFEKDPNAILDWLFDWSDWLHDGETIVSTTVTPASGITVNSTSHSDTGVVVFLAGGSAGSVYRVSCLITTSQSRTDERSINVRVVER